MLRAHFQALDACTKQEIASLLTQRFAELAWKLPSPRKTWQHEHRNMPIFDAVALGAAHFSHSIKD
jgi:hypothetical protein